MVDSNINPVGKNPSFKSSEGILPAARPGRDFIGLEMTPLFSKANTISIAELSPRALNREILKNDKSDIPKYTPINDQLLEEIENTVFAQSQQIETQLVELKGLIHSDLSVLKRDLSSGDTFNFNLLHFTDEQLQAGTRTLVNLFPDELIQQIKSDKKQVRKITRFGLTFLQALSTDSFDVAILCKKKLIDEAKGLLEEFKSQISPGGSAAETQKIEEWSSRIGTEEKKLKEDQQHYSTFRYAYYLNSRFISPLTALVNTLVLKPLNFIFDLTWLTKSFNLIVMATELKKVRNENTLLHNWKDSFQNWKRAHEDIVDKTDETCVSIQSFSKIPTLNSSEEHRENLFNSIENKKFFLVLYQLKKAGIKVPLKINTKAKLCRYLNNHTEILERYIAFRQEAERIDIVIATSKNLVEKRQAIMKKKLMYLLPLYDTIEHKIMKWKKESFLNDMKLLQKELSKPGYEKQGIENCNRFKIRDIFERWNFFGETMLSGNREFSALWERFSSSNELELEVNKKALQDMLQVWMSKNQNIEKQLLFWYSGQSREDLVRGYIDYQGTIEYAVKSSLKEILSQKHEFEELFQNFKSIESHMQFTVSTALLTTSVALGLIGLLALPIGGVGFIFLGLSAVSTILSVGFFIAGTLYASKYKPHSLALSLSVPFKLKMTYAKLRKAISDYNQKSKEKKLTEIAKVLYTLHLASSSSSDDSQNALKNDALQAALIQYEKAKKTYERSLQNVNNWTQQVAHYEKTIVDENLKDFSRYVSLKIGSDLKFDQILNELQTVLMKSDFRLLSTETRELFEHQLGINLETMRNQMLYDPERIKNKFLKFFSLGGDSFFDFITNQENHIKRETESNIS